MVHFQWVSKAHLQIAGRLLQMVKTYNPDLLSEVIEDLEGDDDETEEEVDD